MVRAAVASLALTAGLLLVAAAAPAAARYYRWIDVAGAAHYSEGLDSVPERYRPTAVPLGLRSRPAESAPAARAATPGEIRFTPGERIVVDARINGSASVRLQLDTGADRTLVSPRALAAAGVSLTGASRPTRVIGVTGAARARIAVVDSLEVGGATVGRLPVIVYDVDGADSDGLLGRDFLDHFTVHIDSARGILTLVPK